MTQTTKRILFTAMALIVLLTACLPQQQATPDPVEVANQVATSVALTISAAQAETEAAQPIATSTTLPTQTDSAPPSPTPIVPTATPFVIIPPTLTLAPSSGGGGGGVPAPPPALDCTPINNRPRDNTVFRPGAEFDIRWTIKNTGTRVIPARLDVKYFSGPVMMKVPTDTVRELPEIRPGDTAEIIIDAIAPVERGFHVMTWRVEGDLCYPYVAIIVE